MDLEVRTETVDVEPRTLCATWNVEQTGFFKPPRKSECKYKPYKQGKTRTTKQRNKLRLSNFLIIAHNKRVSSNRVEWKISGVLADEIRKEIDNDIIASLLLYAEQHQK